MPTHITIPLCDIGKYHIFKQPLSSVTNNHADGVSTTTSSTSCTTTSSTTSGTTSTTCGTTSTTCGTTTTTTTSSGGAGSSHTINHSTSSSATTAGSREETWPAQHQELPTQQAQQQTVVVGGVKRRHQSCHHHQQQYYDEDYYYNNNGAGAPTTSTPPEIVTAKAAPAPNKKPRTGEWMLTNKVESSNGIKYEVEQQHPPPQQQEHKFYENNTEGRGCKAVTNASEEAVTTYTNKKPNEEDGTTTTTERAATRTTTSPIEGSLVPGPPRGGEIPLSARMMYHPHSNEESLLRGVPHSPPPDVLTPSLYSSPDTTRTNFISSICTTVGAHGASGAAAFSRNVLPHNCINSDTGANTNDGNMAAQEHQALLTMQRHAYFAPHPPFHYQAPVQSNPPPPPPPPILCVATRIQRGGDYYKAIDSSQLHLMTYMRKMAIDLMGSLPAASTSMASSSLARPRENGLPESRTVEIPTFLKNIVRDPLFENHVKKQQESIQGKEHSSKIASMACRCKLKVKNIGHSRFKGAKCDPVTGRKMQNKFRTKGEDISKTNATKYFVLLKKSFKESSKGFSLPLETDHWDAILPTIYNAFGPGFHDRESLPEYSKGDEVPLALPTRLNKLSIEYTKIGEKLGLKTCACKLRREKPRG